VEAARCRASGATRLREILKVTAIAECSGGRTGAPPARAIGPESRRCRAGTEPGRRLERLLLPESWNGAGAAGTERVRKILAPPRRWSASGPQRAGSCASTAPPSSSGISTISGGTSAISRKTVSLFDGTVADNIARFDQNRHVRGHPGSRGDRRRARDDPAPERRLRHKDRRRRHGALRRPAAAFGLARAVYGNPF